MWKKEKISDKTINRKGEEKDKKKKREKERMKMTTKTTKTVSGGSVKFQKNY